MVGGGSAERTTYTWTPWVFGPLDSLGLFPSLGSLSAPTPTLQLRRKSGQPSGPGGPAAGGFCHIRMKSLSKASLPRPRKTIMGYEGLIRALYMVLAVKFEFRILVVRRPAMSMCMYMYMCMCVYVYMYTCVSVHVYMCMSMYMCMYMYMYLYLYLHACVYKYMYTHVVSLWFMCIYCGWFAYRV